MLPAVNLVLGRKMKQQHAYCSCQASHVQPPKGIAVNIQAAKLLHGAS